MNVREQLFDVYKKCYEQRTVLSKAPALTIHITDFTAETFDYALAREEVGRVMGYLLSTRNIDKLPVSNALESIKKAYENQPFWKNLLLDYLSFRTEEEKEALMKRAKEVHSHAQNVLNEILEQEALQKALIEKFSKPIKEHGFAVNAERLIKNYLSMKQKDADKAWETLITNPAFFSPIITVDKDNKTLLSPQQGKEENKRLAAFLKKLVV